MAKDTTDVLILGGGLSGLVAGATLAETGKFAVTVLEHQRQLGGQVAGWEDEDGDAIETGIHLLFPWYHNFVSLYERLDCPLPLVPTDGNYHVLCGERKAIAVFETSDTLLGSLKAVYAYPWFTVRDKITFTKIVMEAIRLSPAEAETYDGWTVRAYLLSRRASPRLLAFLEIAAMTIQALFAWEASAASFLKFLKHLFASQSDLKPSFFAEPTHRCLVAPLVDCIETHGGTMCTDERVERLLLENGSVSGVQTNKNIHREFDVVLSALPAYVLPRLLPGDLHPRFPGLCRFQSAYVIALQLHFDRRVLPDGQVYVSNRQGVVFDTITDKAFHWDELRGQGSVIQVLVDNGREYKEASDETILHRVLDDMSTYFPATRDAQLTKHLVLRHTEVFTETRPNYFSGVFRASETFLPNLLAAGDWTAEPYHYGMESAVVAGLRAANVLRAREGLPTQEIKQVQFAKRMPRWPFG